MLVIAIITLNLIYATIKVLVNFQPLGLKTHVEMFIMIRPAGLCVLWSHYP